MMNAPVPGNAARTSRLHPHAWPIAVKLSAALVLTALLPMLVMGYINLRGSLAAIEEAEERNLQQQAATTASRLDQFIRDSRYLLSYLAWSNEVIQTAGTASAGARLQLKDTMKRLLAANENIDQIMVLDGRGTVVAANIPEFEGRDLSFRDYFKESIAGRDYRSRLEIGANSGRLGLYLAAPVRAPNGLIAGVLVLKMHGHAITNIVDNSCSAECTPFLIDADGVIVHHPDPRYRYRSLTSLAPEQATLIESERRFGDNKVESLDLLELARQIEKHREGGNADYVSTVDALEKITGFASLAALKWVVVISEPKVEFSRPLIRLYNSGLLSALLIGATFSLIGLAFAQIFLRPLRRLTAAAAAVNRGDYDGARVPSTSRDELGDMAATFNAMVDGIRARERERDIFGRVVSPEVREKLLAGQLTLGGENRRVSVVFSDIRDFSTLSERMSPQDVVSLLNEYLTEMAEAVHPWGGYINNFIGDAIVVVFGAPENRTEIEWSAVGAALDMKSRLDVLNLRRQALGDPALRTGIGISTGKVVAGQVGSLDRFLYTVIGDAVNVAARLETMTKEFPDNPILINSATYEGIRQREGLAIQDLGERPVKGRTEPVHVYGVHEAPRP